ncbi:putative chemoreceptor glutamine deamidase CheD 1 [Dissostichus eleginoides]|uniref:Chemoreceptor glutamine deamidase CheD 1 n=1 Tax=Dissostichus eleginoides TaxID=100907 RepID=A0AAD9F5C2_DISEL|nr:putative chemoreceptor glutamine deamidase CheD 1 [Dissostichus eleginoides]
MGVGNLLLSAAILFSGNTYARMQDISDYLKLPILCKSQFYALQKRYLFPVINETWISCQIGVLDGLSREPKIVLSGDGRCDSPGHSAKYGTYSLMDVDTGLIVDFVVLNKADPSVKNSNAMEPMGLKQCLSNMKKWNISINILTTDRHKTVRKILRVEFPEITHQFDLWHFCKSIIKKIIKACGKKKAFAPLLGWLQSISNHFWWCAESCQGNVEILKEKWDSILYHTANIHVWNDKKLFHACEHPPLGEEDRSKSWLSVGSPAHDALTKVVKNQQIIADLKYCALYCHTGHLEVYHSLINKYVPKRQHFSYEGMACRTQLAAIDHNYGVGRQQATTKSDQPRYDIVVPKSFTNRKKWVAKAVKVPKDHCYREDMMRDVVLMRTHGFEKSHVQLPEVNQNMFDIEKPEKSEVVNATLQNTRFRKKNST